MKWIPYAVLCLSAFACKSQGAKEVDPLPFHVAVLPVDVDKLDLVTMEDAEKIEVQLDIDKQRFSKAMVEALDGKVFARATLLAEPAAEASDLERAAHWFQEAQAAHADLVLDADLSFDEDIGTEINDKFWMNLPLFLLGGPMTWFVNDRTYRFHAKISAEVYDVTAATRAMNTGSSILMLDRDSRVTNLDTAIKEASLDFLDRADGAGSYALSILVPSGFLSKDTKAVPEELEISITEQLGVQLAQAIQDREPDVKEARDLVDFYPEKGRFVTEGGKQYLELQVVMETGEWSDLSSIKYRQNGGEPVELQELSNPDSRGNVAEAGFSARDDEQETGLKRYEVRVPVEEEGPVQVIIAQADSELSARSFTYTPPTAGTK